MSPHLSSTYLSTPTQSEHALLKIETRMQQECVGRQVDDLQEYCHKNIPD